jgi:hypothetical protein
VTAIGVIRAGARSAKEMAAHSRAALDHPLPTAAELWVAVARDEARVLGAFERDAEPSSDSCVTRRGTGGPSVTVGFDTVHVVLSLLQPGVLAPCDHARIVNRYVRPMLRALTRNGMLAHFFGRDWVSVAKQPVAWVGFGHDATTRRTVFEAFVGVRSPIATAPRASFLGKRPGTLESIAGHGADATRIADAIIDAYLDAYDASAVDVAAADEPGSEPDWSLDPPWAATGEEAIGLIGAGPDRFGVLRVGGDLLVSRDALARLEARVVDAPDEQLDRIVDETLAAPGVALDGIRSLKSIRDVIQRARGQR